MCGIFGFSFEALTEDQKITRRINSMTLASKRRGPDGHGFVKNNNIILGHTRLSFRDLSNNGNQPMLFDDAIITFNGEIYNDSALRDETEYGKFKSTSDTESLLVALVKLGINKTLDICKGQFAFAFLEKSKKQITLARDPFGEKPLYYHISKDGYLSFASDISILLKEIDIEFEISSESLNEYFSLGFIPKDKSIYKEVRKVKAGSYIKFDFDENGKVIRSDEIQYFRTLASNLKNKVRDYKPYDYDHIKRLLINSVKLQLTSDVPVGSFLSGGIDSSLVATIAAKELNYNLKTFTIGYNDRRYDESFAAARIAKNIGSDHYNFVPSKSDLIEAVTECSNSFSEPFADSSQIPAFIISKFASKQVKAILSGDGGDEVFGGYNRYRGGLKAWKNLKILRRVFSKNFISFFLKHSANSRILKNKQSFLGINNLDKKIEKLLATNEIDKIDDFYLIALSAGKLKTNQDLLKQKYILEHHLDGLKNSFNADLDERQILTLNDLSIYLADDNLVKMDRISMYHSLEVRCPFLDKELIEYMLEVNPKNRFDTLKSKEILRKILCEYHPQNYLDQPKMGFSIPLDQFLRTDLKDWSYEIIESCQNDFIEKNKALNLWHNHQKGSDFTEELWRLICFLQWEKNKLNN